MFDFNNAQLLIGVLALVLAAILAAKSILGDRQKKSAPFRNYFGAEYRRDLLRHSDLSESDDWRADRDIRFTPFRLRDDAVGEPRIKVTSANRRDR
jgi:hypothetical protein